MSTEIMTEPEARDTRSETLATVAHVLDLPSMPEPELVDFVASCLEERARVISLMDDYVSAGKREIERRLRENGGRSLAHPRAEIELVDEHSPYTYDLDELRAAARLLPVDEALKVVRLIAEAVTVIPAHDEPGKAVSISALLKKYGEASVVGQHLSRGMSRVKTGTKLSFKLRAQTQPEIAQ